MIIRIFVTENVIVAHRVGRSTPSDDAREIAREIGLVVFHKYPPIDVQLMSLDLSEVFKKSKQHTETMFPNMLFQIESAKITSRWCKPRLKNNRCRRFQ